MTITIYKVHWYDRLLRRHVLARVGGRYVVTHHVTEGIVFYMGKPFHMEVVGKVRHDRTDRKTSFQDQLDIVFERAIQRAKVQENKDAGLV